MLFECTRASKIAIMHPGVMYFRFSKKQKKRGYALRGWRKSYEYYEYFKEPKNQWCPFCPVLTITHMVYRLVYRYEKNSNTFNIKYFFKRIAEMKSSYTKYFKLNIVGMVGVTCMLS